MSKEFFRFLRGEINGFYLNKIHTVLSINTSKIKDFFREFRNQQFDLENISVETMYNIGKFAGIHPLWLITPNFYGVAKMTESALFNGVERSERGLLHRDTETFQFEHTDEDVYSDDINTLATSDAKSTMIGLNDTLTGYIAESETDVIDSKGNVKLSKVSETAPTGEAYSDFYGNKFLVLEDEDVQIRFEITRESFYQLFLNMQKIRYNSESLYTLCNIISLICPDGYFKIVSLTKDTTGATMHLVYAIDESVSLVDKEQRLAVLLYLIQIKFPFIIVEENL